MRQTAVESLIEELLPFIDRSKISDVALHLIIEKHITMGKEEIIETYDKAHSDGYKDIDKFGEQYFNERFKKSE